jgi:hypothetical protein
MSTNVRRTWDKDYYEKRAKDRAEKGDDFEENQSSSNKSRTAKLIKVVNSFSFFTRAY